MTNIASIILEVADIDAAAAFYAEFGVADHIELRAAEPPSSDSRGFSLSLVVGQPSTVDSLVGSALAAGATELKPVTKSFWGYGGVVRAPDGTIWKVATSSKKETGPATRAIDDVVLLLGVADVKASKRFYAEQGLAVAKSFGGKYAEFATAPVKLALYPLKGLAKDTGVAQDGTRAHCVVIGSDGASFTDPDGFAWEKVSA
jgi:predicted lactoylglutathione lyase